MYSNSSILIFTDLDGTLLNRDTFKFDSIKTFLKELKKRNIIIIPNSSKTEDEIIEFNNEASFQFPFISENGSIIHTSSGVAARGVKGVGSYSASKGGLVSLSKTIAVENGPTVRCNVIAPGGVTNKVKINQSGDGAKGPFGLDVGKNLLQMPMGRFADPEDLVGAYLFLSGPASNYITGQVIHISGGLVTPSR